jgi:single-stranded-DNA-specific exonuclease
MIARAGPFGAGNSEPVLAFPAHVVAYAEEVGQAHVRMRIRAGEGATLNAIAFRASGQKLGTTLLGARGRPLHFAGSLAVDRWQGAERIQLRIVDAAEPVS